MCGVCVVIGRLIQPPTLCHLGPAKITVQGATDGSNWIPHSEVVVFQIPFYIFHCDIFWFNTDSQASHLLATPI